MKASRSVVASEIPHALQHGASRSETNTGLLADCLNC